MPKTRAQKKEVLTQLQEKIDASKSAVFANFSHISVTDLEDLRNKLREQEVEFFIAKKNLVKLAFKEKGLDPDMNFDELAGNLSMASSQADEVMPAKILAEFAQDHPEDFIVWGGVLEQQFISQAKVNELAQLPSKIELIAKTVGAMRAPLSGLVGVLSGNLRGLVGVLQAVQEKKL